MDAERSPRGPHRKQAKHSHGIDSIRHGETQTKGRLSGFDSQVVLTERSFVFHAGVTRTAKSDCMVHAVKLTVNCRAGVAACRLCPVSVSQYYMYI